MKNFLKGLGLLFLLLCILALFIPIGHGASFRMLLYFGIKKERTANDIVKEKESSFFYKKLSDRFVAITNKAPAHGYSRDDISNDVARGY